MLLTATLLFILLSPGILLTIPPIGGKIWMTGKTTLIAVLVHAVIFYLLLSMRHSIPILGSLEGFVTLGKVSTGGGLSMGSSCSTNSQCSSGVCTMGVCVPKIIQRPSAGLI